MDWKMNFQQSYRSPAGDLTIRATDIAITEIKFGFSDFEHANNLTQNAVHQLQEYFQLRRHSFDLPLNPEGTEFQKAVWNQLLKIPISQKSSYGKLASLVGKPKAARAIGGAVGANPIAIVIPCHRVVATNGKITGYTGGEGIKTKQFLLEMESSVSETA